MMCYRSNSFFFSYYSDDDEPLNNNSLLPFEYPEQITTPKRMLLDSVDINVLKLKQKNLSSSTSSLVPTDTPSSSSCALSSSTSSLVPPSKSSRSNNNKKKAKQTKYPRNEGPSDESSDSSSDELKYAFLCTLSFFHLHEPSYTSPPSHIFVSVLTCFSFLLFSFIAGLL